jgi:hypothetical protein
MGVSGATIRRWEAGDVQPTRRDIVSFAEICDLAPMETEFLIRTFGARRREPAPSAESMEALRRAVADSGLPCFVSDSLFYLRISSSYFDEMIGLHAPENMGINLMEILLRGGSVARDPNEEERIDYWMRGFWLLTARMAGSLPYRTLLNRLRALDGFEERWWQIALTRRASLPPVNLPYLFNHPAHGTFLVVSSMLVAPPIYQLRQYWPADSTAEAFVKALRKAGPPSIAIAAVDHWSQGEEAVDTETP